LQNPETNVPVARDKRFKRYRWVEEKLWRRLAAGERASEATDAAFDDRAFHQGQQIWASGQAGAELSTWLEELFSDVAEDGADTASPAFWRVATLPHVAVDRHTRAGNIYHLSATWFAPGVDLALPVI